MGDLKKKYSQLLREGKTEEATKVAQEMTGATEDEEEVVAEEELVSEQERFAELKGVGGELADEMVQVFGDYDSFVEDASVENLSDISGIGESRAESLLEQVE